MAVAQPHDLERATPSGKADSAEVGGRRGTGVVEQLGGL